MASVSAATMRNDKGAMRNDKGAVENDCGEVCSGFGAIAEVLESRIEERA
ncbi:hypothetical protein H6F93_10385 [Leptolyngbya sp. FACHB-671]|nr:hypothetical protein [Leptolyngbya sp. FACHB-671]MBD2067925.1 hypothetical protein [Leptolyngbya sp. FACHB-671]